MNTSLFGCIDLLDAQAEFVSTPEQSGVEFIDPDDIPILACAISSEAYIFVTGDKAVLDLGTIENIPILSLRQYWQKLA